MPEQKPSDYYQGRISGMRTERSTFIPHYVELARFVTPRRGRFAISDHNQGGAERFNKIVNSKATRALRVARGGLIAGIMSPAQPSFAYRTSDPDLNDYLPVKVWLDKLAQINRMILNEGNFYNMAPPMIGELLLFGTGCMTHVDDFDDVARFYTHTVGSYMIGQDEKLRVNTLVREFEWQVSQIVAEFGYDNCSVGVKNAYDRGNYESWWPVTHFIGENRNYRPSRKASKYKRFESVYFEPGEVAKDQYLRQAGFDDFPAYCPRWDVTGEDTYATDCPGMTALGDIMGLQTEERRKAQAIDKMVSPPLKGPASLKNVQIRNLPGGATLYDSSNDKDGLSPVYQVNPQLQELRLDMAAVEDRIDDAFFVKLFLAISDMEGIQPRNQLEIKQRDQERLLQLGDPLQRMYGEFLNPMHDRLLAQGFRHGIYPPAPQEVQGKQIKPHYIGPLAMAQRSAAAGAMERTATFISGLAALSPTAAQKLDTDALVEEYADTVGLPAKLLVPDEVLTEQRKAAAQAEAAKEQAATGGEVAGALNKGAGAVNQLANAPTQGGGSSALEDILNAVKDRAAPNAFQGR